MHQLFFGVLHLCCKIRFTRRANLSAAPERNKNDLLDLLRVFATEVDLSGTVVLTARCRVLPLGRGLIVGTSDFCRVQRAPKRPGLPTPQEGHDFIGDRLDLGTIKRHSWAQGTPLDSCRLHRDDSFAHHRRCLKQLQGEARGRGVMMHPMLVFELERIFACEVLDAAVGIQVDLLTFARSCAPPPRRT